MKDNIVVVFSSHLGDEKNNEFIKHIDDTIGVNHEVVCYTNYNQYSLAELYNKAIKEYNKDNIIMVFCHPDITIKTRTWGRLLLSKFNNSNFSIIGVAGTTTLLESAQWWQDRSKMYGVVEHTDGIQTWVSEYAVPIKGYTKPVVLVDGVFMAVDCDRLEHQWDEDFKGFHLYDLGLCVPNYLDGCNIGVTTDIRILHQSVGMVNPQWEANRLQFIEKYKDELPILMTLPPTYNDFNIKLTNEPKVSVIIPTKNNFELLQDNIESWNDIVKYKNYEILIADTGSNDDVIKNYDEILNDKVKLIRYNYYNFGKINNDMVKNHTSEDTELVLFCNDDIKLLNDALSRCIEIYNKNKNTTGTIGIRLHYGDDSIQHNGIMFFKDLDNKINLSHKDIRKTENYRTNLNMDSLGNTGAFLLINKKLFLSIGGFNENYLECFEDVELNLECKKLGLKNITISDAVAYHYESVSRNKIQNGINNQIIDYQKLLTYVENNNFQIK